MKNLLKIILTGLSILFLMLSMSMAEEGMYPISEIGKLGLQKKGLKITSQEIFNPNGVSLVDAICKVGGGCTGSFVSNDGLVLTNHHCAYRATQAASSRENDYIANGFVATTRDKEIIAKGYTIRITDSYKDVSKEVLSVVNSKMSLAKRTKAIEKKMKEIVKEAEKKHPDKRAEVSEMFKGKTYVLFIYTNLKDVRMVYIPPHSIGNFGGEVDNWEWPRHTGDFSFLRAYVAPDGSPAEYSENNVPFHPKKYLQIAPQGVNEEDFAFILGYPGRTYRHTTSDYIAFDQEAYMPYIIQLYDWLISTMEEIGKDDRSIAIKHAAVIKGLANVSKKYKGRLQGLQRLNLVAQKKAQEKKMQAFINSNPKLKKQYGTLLNDIAKIYQEYRTTLNWELLLRSLTYYRSSKIMNYAFTIYEGSIERTKKDIDRKSSYMERNFPRTQKRLIASLQDYYEPTEKLVLKEFFLRAAKLPKEQQIPAISKIIKNKDAEKAIDEFLEKAFTKTKLRNKEFLEKNLNASKKEILATNDPFILFVKDLYPTYKQRDEKLKIRKGALGILSAKLIDVKKQFEGKNFVPDANSTLRFTFGHIRGYTPRDAVYCAPFTTIEGILEKNTGHEPFHAPDKLLNLIKKKDYGRFKHPKYKSVPVDILYDMDTTGGNSGSPIINAKGELIGLNFDRAFEATINDYTWSKDYSRSIGVDVRYILWVLQKYGEADYLLKEMNVN